MLGIEKQRHGLAVLALVMEYFALVGLGYGYKGWIVKLLGYLLRLAEVIPRLSVLLVEEVAVAPGVIEHVLVVEVGVANVLCCLLEVGVGDIEAVHVGINGAKHVKDCETDSCRPIALALQQDERLLQYTCRPSHVATLTEESRKVDAYIACTGCVLG